MPYKDKSKYKERMRKNRLNPEYKKREKEQQILKMATPEEKERRKKYKSSEKGKEAERKYRYSKKGREAYIKSHLKRHYGIGITEVNKILIKQNSRCALCGDSFIDKPYVIDHNHKTGEIRGLIHQRCNLLIGLINENIWMLELAIDYLQKHQK